MAKNFSHWPPGWPRTLDYPERPVFFFLDQTAERVPHRLALHFGGMELTYAELKALTDRFAAALHRLGVEKGDRVAVHLPNCPQFCIAYYALLENGAVFTPLSPLLSPREMVHQLSDSGARVLVTLDLLHPLVAGVLADTQVEKVISTSIADCYTPLIQPLKPVAKTRVPDTLDMVELIQAHDASPPRVDIDVNQDLAHLAYTGGTTGVSKGVMLTHQNVVANVLQVGCWYSGAWLEERDGRVELVYPEGVDPVRDRKVARDRETTLAVTPWFHAMGTISLSCFISAGYTMVIFPRFEPVEYLEAVSKYRATALSGAPQLYVPLLGLPGFEKYDLSSVRVTGSGAAPLPLTVLEKMKEAFPEGVVVEAYGLTECTMGATFNPLERDMTRPGSVGLPIFDTECKVVNADTGQELPPGEPGEICINGPQVMRGYWNRPQATAEVLRDGWLYTGDIGKQDEDGYFFITDRKKDLILYKGYNVYPRELEEVLYTHPAVELCAVVGKPDPDAGELPVACVQLKAGQQATPEQIAAFVNQQVAAYKKLRQVQIVDAIPVSGAGKVLRREIRDRVRAEAG